MKNQKLHVIAVHSNPARYESRKTHTQNFIRYMLGNSKVQLHVVEALFGDRPSELTETMYSHHCDPRSLPFTHTKIKTTHEIWNKEALINQALTRLPQEAEYVAWIDADIQFTRGEWAEETIEALQHYAVVQPWSHSVDLGPNHEALASHKSFCHYFTEGMPMGSESTSYNAGYAHSGFAWAARRSALNSLGGPLCAGPLIDFAVLGSADFYQAWALIGRLGKNLYNDVHSLPFRKKGFTRAYLDALFHWQTRAQSLKQNIGYVKGTVLHYWHGPKKKRYYNSRENILIEHDYNPFTDIRRDINGLPTWVEESQRQIKLKHKVRQYMRARDEDSRDLD